MYDYIKIPEITDGFKFESLVLDIFSKELRNIQKNGRLGQRQNGVDIYGYNNTNELVGLQCKVKSKADINDKKFFEAFYCEIESEVSKATKFNNQLHEYKIITTAPRDSNLQAKIINLNHETNISFGFGVQVLFWDDICDILTNEKHKETFVKYFNNLIIREEIVGSIRSRVISLVVGIEPEKNYTGCRDVSLFQLVLGYIPKLNKYPNGIEYYSNTYMLGCFQSSGMDTFPIPCYPSDLDRVIRENMSYRDRCTIVDWLNSINIDEVICSEQVEYEYLWNKERYNQYLDRMSD